jgi:rhodanese-related sulfurtransferase
VASSISALAPQPPNFQAIVARNRGPLRSGRGPALEPLTPRQLQARERAGALVVDVRTDVQFDDAHVPGAICNPAVRAGFGTKLAWVAEPGQELVFVGRDDLDAQDAARLAEAVGITSIAGYLAGGMTSWREDRLPVASLQRIDVVELRARGDAVQVLDVRQRAEWEAGHVPGSAWQAYHDVRGLPAELDAGRPVAVICSSGQRAAIAASVLARQGVRDVIHVAGGGVGTWAARGYPLERAAREPAALE